MKDDLYDGVALKRDHFLVEVLHCKYDEIIVDAIKQT